MFQAGFREEEFGCPNAYRDNHPDIRCRAAKGVRCADVPFEDCKYYK